jgi:hypothetical protein
MIDPQLEIAVNSEFSIKTVPPQSLSSTNELNSYRKFLKTEFYKSNK